MRELSEKQRQTLEAVARGCARGAPPTERELGVELGLRSTNAVHDRLSILIGRGILRRVSRRARGLVVTERGWLLLVGTAWNGPSLECCPTCRRPL